MSVESRSRTAAKRAEARSLSPYDVSEILGQRFLDTARDRQATLARYIVGRVRLCVRDNKEEYLFSWQDGEPKLERASAEVFGDEGRGSPSLEPECTIELDSHTLAGIAAGSLNPQIAITAGKIVVRGEVSSGLYFFNLIAP